jgi:hypothetical protein
LGHGPIQERGGVARFRFGEGSSRSSDSISARCVARFPSTAFALGAGMVLAGPSRRTRLSPVTCDARSAGSRRGVDCHPGPRARTPARQARLHRQQSRTPRPPRRCLQGRDGSTCPAARHPPAWTDTAARDPGRPIRKRESHARTGAPTPSRTPAARTTRQPSPRPRHGEPVRPPRRRNLLADRLSLRIAPLKLSCLLDLGRDRPVHARRQVPPQRASYRSALAKAPGRAAAPAPPGVVEPGGQRARHRRIVRPLVSGGHQLSEQECIPHG